MTSHQEDETNENQTEPPEEVIHLPSGRTRVSATYFFIRYLISPVVRLLWRVRVEGRRNVPRRGAVIFASNHLSFIDSIVIPMASPRPVFFMAKASYFTKKGLKGRFIASFMRGLGAIPVERGAGASAMAALDQQRQRLAAGRAIALYPEGTRSKDGRLYKGRTGVAFMALEEGVPVLPIGLIGTDAKMPIGSKRPKLGKKVVVRFGTLLDLSEHGPASSGKARRTATDEIMAAIHELSEQELAGKYNEVPAQGPINKIKQALPHERL